MTSEDLGLVAIISASVVLMFIAGLLGAFCSPARKDDSSKTKATWTSSERPTVDTSVTAASRKEFGEALSYTLGEKLLKWTREQAANASPLFQASLWRTALEQVSYSDQKEYCQHKLDQLEGDRQ